MTGRTIRFTMGLLSFIIGAGIIVGVLYDCLFAKAKEFKIQDFFGGFGMSGIFIAVGLYWMRIAVKGASATRKTTDELMKDSSRLP